ncbi:MAG: flagellar basal-body rod protein FlgG, partial [Lachnospiraceae bacterium]|nr:flagellar basal-body rod protein FlgG [Lachnospiraceae bacterium]
GSIFLASDASGEPQLEVNSPNLKASVVKQMYLEQSNVSAVDEMVNLIVAQRAYEMNSKIITASDDMLRTANNLRQ